MEELNQPNTLSNEVVEVGYISYFSPKDPYTVTSHCGKLYIRNTFGLLSILIEDADGKQHIVVTEDNRIGSNDYNACFKKFHGIYYLNLPDSMIRFINTRNQSIPS